MLISPLGFYLQEEGTKGDCGVKIKRGLKEGFVKNFQVTEGIELMG